MLSEYSRYLENRVAEESLSPLSAKNYLSDVTRALKDFTELRDLAKFVRAGTSTNTKTRRYYSVQSYIRWAVSEGHLPEGSDLDGLMAKPKPKPGLPRAIRASEYSGIVDLVYNGDGLSDAQRLVVMLLMHTGCRVSEVLKLHTDDIEYTVDPETAEAYFTLFIEGKGGYRDTVFINHDLTTERVSSKLLAKLKEPGALFPGLDYYTFRRAWKANITKEYKIHQLRHTFATALIQKAGVEVVQRALRHRSITTTLRYAQLHDKTLRNALKGVSLV